MSAFDDELASIISELRGIADRLDSLAFQALREAVARGDSRRPEIERRITRARNALLRAVPLLGARRDDGDEQFGDD